MKRLFFYIIKGLCSCIIDLFVVLSIAFSAWNVAENTSGTLFPNKAFMGESLFEFIRGNIPFLASSFVIYIIIALIFKRSVGIMLCFSNLLRKAGLLFAALIVDFSVTLTVTLLMDYILQDIIYIETFDILFTVILVYAVIAGLCRGKTLGRIMFGITVISKTGN